MTEPIERWQRLQYQAGGGDAFLFYIVYGKIDVVAQLPGKKYRVDRVPNELDFMVYGPQIHPQTVDSFREGHVWNQLKHNTPGFAARIAAQESCLILRGSFKDPSTLDYLRDTIGLVTHFLDQGGVAVYDPQMLEWWTPRRWRETVFGSPPPVPQQHVAILMSKEETDHEWVHTRGLRKFGRPDLSIPNLTPEIRNEAIELCKHFIHTQSMGALIPEKHEVTPPAFPEKRRCFHRGSFDDPDFNNVHLAITSET